MKKKICFFLFSLFFTLFLFKTISRSSTTKFMIDYGIANFEEGNFENIAVDRHGYLSLSPKINELFQKEDILSIWTIEEDSIGNLYFGTSNKARIYRYDKKGTTNLIQEFDNAISVSSIVSDSNNNLYVAVNPNSNIYKINSDGKIINSIPIEAEYIWKMVKDNNNNLYIATGNPATIYKLNSSNQLEKLYLSESEAHFLSLAINSSNQLYFGSEGKGILYRYNMNNKSVKVLFDSYEDEIKDIVIGTNDKIYIATASKIPKKLPKTFNYTDSFNLYGSKKTKSNIKKMPIKNSVYELNSSGQIKKLFTKNSKLFLSLTIDKKGNLYVGSASDGLIYKIRGLNDAVIFVDTEEEHILSLKLNFKNELLVTTSGIGKVLKIKLKDLSNGTYKSRIFDAQGIANWGKLSWETENSNQGKMDFYVRQGNSEDPDETWSPWIKQDSKTYKNEIYTSVMNIESSQYIQYKVIFSATKNGESPILKKVYLSCLPENRAPQVEQITLSYNTEKKLDNEDPFNKIIPPIVYTLNWRSSDQDYDLLTYDIYFKGIQQNQWILLKSNINDKNYSFDARKISDGQYHFKVIASDKKSNNHEMAKSSFSKSQIFKIDHTPPIINNINIKQSSNQINIQGKAIDNLSFIKMIQYSLNGSQWIYLGPEDSIYDSEEENFYFKLKTNFFKNKKLVHKTNNLILGENTLILRVLDMYHNFSTKNITFNIKAPNLN